MRKYILAIAAVLFVSSTIQAEEVVVTVGASKTTVKIDGVGEARRDSAPIRVEVRKTNLDGARSALDKAGELAQGERDSDKEFALKSLDTLISRKAACPAPCPRPCPPAPCCNPGPIPSGLGVCRWLNATHTSFLDQYNRRWDWCSTRCCWVDP